MGMGVSSVVLYNYIRGFCYSFYLGIIIANNYCVHLFVTHFILIVLVILIFYYCIINFLGFFIYYYTVIFLSVK